MTRWLWVLLAAVVLIGLGVFFWSTSNQTNTPPVAQVPAPAPQPAAQAPAPAPQPETDEAKQAADLETRANENAKTELASLKSGFSAKDLIAALNDSVINFPSGSAEVRPQQRPSCKTPSTI
jgi:hypothetical protein